jgi:hypothetical protein
MITKIASLADLAAASQAAPTTMNSAIGKARALFVAADVREAADRPGLPAWSFDKPSGPEAYCGVEWDVAVPGGVAVAMLISCMGMGDYALIVGGKVLRKGTRMEVLPEVRRCLGSSTWGASPAVATAVKAHVERYTAQV